MYPIWVIDKTPVPGRQYAIAKIERDECKHIRFKTSRTLKDMFRETCKERGHQMHLTIAHGIVALSRRKIDLAVEDFESVQNFFDLDKLSDLEPLQDSFFTSPFIRDLLDGLLKKRGFRRQQQHLIINALIAQYLRKTAK